MSFKLYQLGIFRGWEGEKGGGVHEACIYGLPWSAMSYTRLLLVGCAAKRILIGSQVPRYICPEVSMGIMEWCEFAHPTIIIFPIIDDQVTLNNDYLVSKTMDGMKKKKALLYHNF